MKKLFLICLLILGGCTQEVKNEYIIEVKSNIVDVKDEKELVSYLDKNLNKDIMKLAYKSKQKIDVNEVVQLLSFLCPFDLKLKKFEEYNDIETYQVIEIEYINAHYKEVKEKAQNILNDILLEGMNDKEKMDVIHKYLIDTCKYDKSIKKRDDTNSDAFQVYGVLFDHKGVCTGYARAFLLLLKMSGVPCLYVPSEVMNHSFNLTYSDIYRYVDVTWDDDNDNVYYNLSVKNFFKDGEHHFDKGYNNEYYVDFLAYIYHLK